jgi:small subunit ribosomal protein S6
MIIFKPDLSEQDRKTLFNQINDAVTKNNGNITNAAVWSEKRKLFFPIKKYYDGVYYLLNFSAPALSIRELRHAFKLNENILRVLITKLE